MHFNMFQRMLRHTISSNQFNAKSTHIFDIKWFSFSSPYSNNTPLFNVYFRMTSPKLKEEHPKWASMRLTQLAAEKWNKLSEKEKELYREIRIDKMEEYETDGTMLEIKKMKKEIDELVHDRPIQYRNNWTCLIGVVMRKSKGGNEDGTSLYPAAHKEWLSMNEKERSDLRKKFDKSREDLEKWKQKVKEDGRAKRIKDLESSINERLKILQHDKPKCMRPFVCFLQQHNKGEKMENCKEKWNSLSAAEKEPYYEPINKYKQDIVVWKEKTRLDGRKMVITTLKKLRNQLKL